MKVYKGLDKSLHAYADAAQKYFATHWGISASKFVVEKPVIDALGYKPTLQAETQDHHILCVDVVQTLFMESLSDFILRCMAAGTPLKLFIAVPPDSPSILMKELESARDVGIGVIRMAPQPSILHHALSLSLTGVRRPVIKEYPATYRQTVETALATFLDGNPSKGCLELYEKIEDLTRKVAAKAEKKGGCWKDLSGTRTTPGLKWDTAPWSRVMDALYKHLDVKKLGCGSLSSALLGATVGVVPDRNDVGHTPSSLKRRIKRDAALRTRFEHAADLLRDLAAAVKPLHL